ncbi:MAG: methyltransferase domain-containing protein, partial [Actinomycetota bacterium]|nr:methyltransferase domain-containing protein [Actinomycetota bacterium]
MGDMTTRHTAAAGQVTDTAARLYERFFVPALFGQWPNRLLDLCGAGSGDDVLDIACGTGVVARAARSRVGATGSVAGLDPNAGMLDVARGLAPEITWIPGRAEALPMADGSYDRVFCQFGLMFFADRAAAVAEMARVLRPGGRVCIATWAQLAETPGYAAMVELLDEMFGARYADALAAPFCIGTSAELTDIVRTAFDDVE